MLRVLCVSTLAFGALAGAPAVLKMQDCSIKYSSGKLVSSCDLQLLGAAGMPGGSGLGELSSNVGELQAKVGALETAMVSQGKENAALRKLIVTLTKQLAAQKSSTDSEMDELEAAYKAADDALQHDIASVKKMEGPKGPKGDRGEKGDKGDKGDTGATGAMAPAPTPPPRSNSVKYSECKSACHGSFYSSHPAWNHGFCDGSYHVGHTGREGHGGGGCSWRYHHPSATLDECFARCSRAGYGCGSSNSGSWPRATWTNKLTGAGCTDNECGGCAHGCMLYDDPTGTTIYQNLKGKGCHF